MNQALERAGWPLRTMDRIEINEAFAAIAIVVTRELGLPEDIVNVEGGAIAHGHPIGAILTTRLIHSINRAYSSPWPPGLTGSVWDTATA
jgi:acetyl-CoA C-acetyltransferase